MAQRKPPNASGGVTRRDFSRGAVLLLAGSTVAPASLVSSPNQGQTQGGDLPESVRAEIESKMQNVLSRWGGRLNEDQKTRMRNIITRHVRMLETVRAYPVENGDSPASVLKIVEKRSIPAASAGRGGQTLRRRS